jgi:hypothetical protein
MLNLKFIDLLVQIHIQFYRHYKMFISHVLRIRQSLVFELVCNGMQVSETA